MGVGVLGCMGVGVCKNCKSFGGDKGVGHVGGKVQHQQQHQHQHQQQQRYNLYLKCWPLWISSDGGASLRKRHPKGGTLRKKRNTEVGIIHK